MISSELLNVLPAEPNVLEVFVWEKTKELNKVVSRKKLNLMNFILVVV